MLNLKCINSKPYFSNKHSKTDTGIMFTENWELVLTNNEITDTCNDYLRAIVEDLDLHFGRTTLNFFQILNLLIESIT